MKRPLSYLILFVAAALSGSTSGYGESWRADLESEIEKIDAATPGEMGVFIRRIDTGESLSYAADRPWYLASTTKVPVAIALLQKVEAGELSLTDTLTLDTADYRDGSGDLVWRPPGSRVSTSELLEKMLTQSDSTAADMLIGRIGVEKLNAQIHDEMVSEGFGPVTSLLRVRQEGYGELHPDAKRLSNMDFIDLKKVAPAQRLDALMEKLSIPRAALKAQTIPEAFERYYRRGNNTASLTTYASLLERLAQGELLSPRHTGLVLDLMEKMETGENRIKAGLPENIRIAQKTGTQLGRICNMGILRPRTHPEKIVVVAACLEKFTRPAQAEMALQKLGAAMISSGVLH